MGEARKKAIVTGASRGIGKGIAVALAKAGYDLAISYHSRKEEAEQLRGYIENTYQTNCYIFQAKLEETGAGVKLFDQATQKLDGLDLLVNNAGVTIFETIYDLQEETLDFLIALDFKNYLLMTREAACYMADHGIKGSIINITSTRGERAYPGDGVYGGLKAGLNRAIQSIAMDVAPQGIRVNNVAPGAIRIRTKEEIQQDAGLKNTIPVDFWDSLGDRIVLGRSGLPEDIGEAVVFLASEAASYITGVTLRVDGGLILPGMPEIFDDTRADKGWGYIPRK